MSSISEAQTPAQSDDEVPSSQSVQEETPTKFDPLEATRKARKLELGFAKEAASLMKKQVEDYCARDEVNEEESQERLQENPKVSEEQPKV